MKPSALLRVALLASVLFGVGVILGYSTHAPSDERGFAGGRGYASPDASGGAPARADLDPVPPGGDRSVKPPLPIRIDAEGNFLLAPAMVDRLRCLVLNGTKLDPTELQILGLNHPQIDQLQGLIDGVYQGFFERTRSAMQEFTAGEEELVWKIPGDSQSADADRQKLIDGIHAICGSRAELTANFLVAELERQTAQFGRNDYFLRVHNPGRGDGMLAYENIVIDPKLNQGAQPMPGSSFMDYHKRWNCESFNRYGGKAPPATVMPLLRDKDWQRLLKVK